MPRPPPAQDTLRSVFAALAAGKSANEVAREHGVSASAVLQWRKRYGGTPSAVVPASPSVDVSPLPLPLALVEIASDLEQAGLAQHADVCRRASSALTELARPVAPTVRVDAGNAVETAYEMLTAMVDDARRAAALGNYTAASKAMAAASKLLNDVERLRARTSGDDDMIHVSRRELAEAERLRDERDRIVLSRPLTCERCGAELAVAWAEERDGALQP